MASEIPIIDSHIHVYPEAELNTLAWYTEDSLIGGRRSVEEFKSASASASSQVQGFVFLEADRKNDSSQSWTGPLAEIAWLRRIATGQPREGEGHTAEDAKLCLGIIPWAPMNLGAAKLEEYLAQAEKEAGPETWKKVKGFRYLLQDKPNGTALSDDFIDGLRLLGKKGFVFDVGIDQHRRGRVQLEEVVEMIDRAHDGVPEEEKVVFILNHLCKPDLTVVNHLSDTGFNAWRTAMFTLSKCKQTYMKLSGCFAEMPDSLKVRPAEDIFMALFPWLAIVLASFGSSRIMFASDWPVCTVGVDGAWEKWKKVVERTCYMATISDEDQKMLWAGTARKAYRLDAEEE
ncbi:putative amidohydrolase family protein [Diplogelasinospora grovesii]|uniref:Amidohydrolase family protein n=1 Tax=Diplogelasinospora grovesii TaxID=303347 RepID=A0AAN6NIR3_9PEZI|nr:putative amidohydrolase family protein [Diplogelasinospora grovesii]